MKALEQPTSSEQAPADAGNPSVGPRAKAAFEAPCILWEHEFVALTGSPVGPPIRPPGCDKNPHNPNCW